jgi:hypothetical protein
VYAWQFHDARRFEAYLAFREATVEHVRVCYASAPGRHPPAPQRATLEAADMHARDLTGAYPPEPYAGASLRWLRPFAAIDLALPHGHQRVTLDTAAVRGAGCAFPLAFCWNGSPIAPSAITRGDGRVSFAVAPASFVDGPVQRLVILSAPIDQAVDPRSLGFPLVSIASEPLPPPASA